MFPGTLRVATERHACEMGDANELSDKVFHLYDAAMRLWAEQSLPEVAGWLDPMVKGVPVEVFEKLATRFAVPVMEADLLIKAGEDHLIHVEYQTFPDDSLVQRMYDYRGRIMRAYSGMRLTQYIIVLGNGMFDGFDVLDTRGFAIDVRVIYLREHDPGEFLADAILAPFAVLAKGSRVVREESLAKAFRLLAESQHPRRRVLLQVTEALARIRLDASTIARIEKENGMSIEPMVDFYCDTEVGHRLQDIGRKEGIEKGLEQGMEKGSEAVLLALLQCRFGDGTKVQDAARWLAGWNDQAAAVTAIVDAADLPSLLSVECPPPQPDPAQA